LVHAANASNATEYTLVAMAAVVLGGTPLTGGRGGLVGPLLGAFSIYLLQNLLATFAINPAYLQIVYGGILIVWDRLFGTYQREVRPPVYGVTHPLRSHSPFWANVAPFAEIARLARYEPTWRGKVRTWFAHPRGKSAGAATAPSRATFAKYAPPSSRSITGYVTAHFVVLALGAGAFMSLAEGASIRPVLLPGLLVLASAAALGAWTEGRRWALPFDLGRQLAIVAWFGWFAWSHAGAVASATAVGALALAFLAIFVTTRPWRAWALA